jgi:uncharacterized protein (DUF362 family)
MKSPVQSRREFLRNLAIAPIGAVGVGQGWLAASGRMRTAAADSTSPSAAVRVAVGVRQSAVMETGEVKWAEVASLLDDSLLAFTGLNDAQDVWRSLLKPSDTVGIKVNCLAGRGLSSHPELIAAIVDGVASAGVPREKIIIWDRSERELAAAGFDSASVNGARVLATDSRRVGYEREIEFAGEVGSCFSRMLSRICTAIIDVPVMKDHDLSGVSLGMKNFYGAIHNPNKYHDNNCNPYIADLCTHPLIKKKLRLVICDGLRGQYHGGPAYRPQWAWPAATLLIGSDLVAVDRVGLEIIETKRQREGMPSLKEAGRPADYIESAAQRGLGTANMESILRINVS